MAASRNYTHGLKVAVTVILISSLTFLPSKSVGLGLSSLSEISVQQRKMVLGSRPPGCVNKCMSCRPCMATLVIHPHQKRGDSTASSHGEDDSYYLLSWKCRCGNKLYQP
ncbi:hypothetical protein F0562_023066 [Nyssa sinensis]|uniref:Epidermal patterning factor-like protein n=1 Tax=Nyssa sinensis TaxID=561372 RepID=A0A5J5BGW7_9ASTE|nr:hypothetical protein F0562_023066 [Nyssa sinensis]